jgi:hypothetical protein
VAGIPPLGSVPAITADILGGPYVVTPLAWIPYAMTEIGPQFDLLIANPSVTCTFDLEVTIDGPATSGTLEPGAELQVGAVIGSPGFNLPPYDLTPADIYAAQYYRENAGAAPETFSDGTGTKDQISLFVVPGLQPGWFIWLSVQTLIATAGFTGASTISLPTGYGLSVQGVRV